MIARDPNERMRMTDEPILDATTMARIREQLRGALVDAPLPPPCSRPNVPPDVSPAAVDADAETMQMSADICDVRKRSYRALDPVLQFARRVARKLLSPSLERQVDYNTANHRLVRALRAQIDTLKLEQRALKTRCEQLARDVEALRRTVPSR